MGDIYLQLKNISPIQLKDFPIELRNNGQKPIFELLVAQGDPLSASFYLYNVIRGKDHYKSQLANHLFNQ